MVSAISEIFISNARKETQRNFCKKNRGKKLFKPVPFDLNLSCHATMSDDLTFLTQDGTRPPASILKLYPYLPIGETQQRVLHAAVISWQPLPRMIPENHPVSCKQDGLYVQ